MRFKKTMATLLVGASVLATGGAVTLVAPKKVDAGVTGIPTVTFTGIDAAKVHTDAGSATELYLTFISQDTGSDVPQPAYVAGGATEDNSARLMHFAKQIQYVDGETGETYNFASAGKVTTQGTTAGDAGNANILFQKVDENGNVIAFNSGDMLRFPRGMVYEVDTNNDAQVDKVWKFDTVFEVTYLPGVACANVMGGCIGQDSTGDNCCNATKGYHVYRDPKANDYDVVAVGQFGGVINASTLGMKFSSTSTVTDGVSSIDLGYTNWVDPDNFTNAFCSKILINGTSAGSSGARLQGFDQKDGLCLSGFSLAVGGTVVIPQDVTFTAPSGAKMTTMCKFTYTWNGTNYDVTATYMNETIPARVGVAQDRYSSGGQDGPGDSGNQGGSSDSGNQGTTEPKPNRLLSSFTSADTNEYHDDAFWAQASEISQDYKDVHKTTGKETIRKGTTWDVDFKSTITYDKVTYDNLGDAYPWWINNSYTVSRQFVGADQVPAGSDGNGAFKFSWNEKIPNFNFPAVMFNFPKNIEAEGDDELEFTIYFSETLNPGYTLWATSALQTNVWDTQKKFSGSLIPRGRWTTISMPIKDFTRSDGTLAPIAFIFVYSDIANQLNTPDDGNNTNDGLDAAEIYFDKVEIKTVIKTLESNYRTQDLSEVVPITQKMTFTGEETKDVTVFDFTKDSNIKFIREDITTNVVSMKMSISDTTAFDVYFVMNGTGKYYDKGGLFYWISNEGCSIGYNGKAFHEGNGKPRPLPAAVTSGREFTLEIRAIPYYVEGQNAGYFAAMYINGVEACNSGYISKADCNFGQYFGYYMHTTKTNVSTTIAPVTQATTSPLSLTVKSSPTKKHLDINDYVLMKSTLKCKMYGQSKISIEVLEGTDYAVMDEDYLVGVSSGIVAVVAKVTNVFGTFTGEPFYIAIGDAQLPQDSEEDSAQDSTNTSQTPPASEDDEPDYIRPNPGNSGVKTGGCGASIGISTVALLAVTLTASFVLKKSREE